MAVEGSKLGPEVWMALSGEQEWSATRGSPQEQRQEGAGRQRAVRQQAAEPDHQGP